MGCLGFPRRKNKAARKASSSISFSKGKTKRSDEDASVWPLPAAAPPPPPPPSLSPLDRSPVHVVHRSSSARRPHPLPAPTSSSDFSSRGRSPPQPLPPVPSLSSTTSWKARSGRQLRRFDYERLARLCNQFAHRSQVRDSVYRCFLEHEDMSVDVVLVRHSTTRCEEEWIDELNRVALLEHRNVCRMVGFAAANSRRLVVFEAPASSSGVDEMLLLPSERNRARLQQLDFNWDTRLKIALAAAQGLAFLHESSPFQASRFGPSNVLVSKMAKTRSSIDAKLQLLLTQESCDAAKASNVTFFGIFLLELLSGKMNMERLIIHGDAGGSSFGRSADTGDGSSSSQGLFVKWARGVVNDSGKLSSILDPRLLLHCKPLSARDLANFALSCLDQDPRLRPRMLQAVSLLKSLIAMRELQQSSKINARTVSGHSSSSPASSSTSSCSSTQQQQQQHHFLGRSATFSYHQGTRRRDLTPPPPRMSSDMDHHDWHPHATRSAGASPASRYMASTHY